MELLGIGRVELHADGLQLQIQGGTHNALHIPGQAVQVLIQDADQLLVLLVGGHLQVMPELLDLRPAQLM